MQTVYQRSPKHYGCIACRFGQHLEGGVIRELLVQEGDLVNGRYLLAHLEAERDALAKLRF